MSVLKKNLSFLFIIQISNYVFPLITLPYLGRVLGANGFGVLALSQAVIQYFVFLTDYGFNLSATRKISIKRDDKYEVSTIFFSTIYAKIILLFLAFFILVILVIFSSRLAEISPILFVFFITVCGNVLFPIWLFQGLEEMWKITVYTTIAKFISLFSTFLLVKNADDILAAAFTQSLGILIAGFISIVYIYKKKLVFFIKPDIDKIYIEIKDGFALFISSIAISFYTTFNTVLLGFFSNSAIVGNYAAAEKLRAAIQSLFTPVQQAVFPRISQEISSGENIKIVLKRYGSVFIFFGFSVSIGMFIFGEFFTKVFYGGQFSLAPVYLKYMSPLPFIVSIAIVLGTWGLSAAGRNSVFSRIYILGSIIHVLYAIPLVYFFNVSGLIISVILTETILTSLMFFVVNTKTK